MDHRAARHRSRKRLVTVEGGAIAVMAATLAVARVVWASGRPSGRLAMLFFGLFLVAVLILLAGLVANLNAWLNRLPAASVHAMRQPVPPRARAKRMLLAFHHGLESLAHDGRRIARRARDGINANPELRHTIEALGVRMNAAAVALGMPPDRTSDRRLREARGKGPRRSVL